MLGHVASHKRCKTHHPAELEGPKQISGRPFVAEAGDGPMNAGRRISPDRPLGVQFMDAARAKPGLPVTGSTTCHTHRWAKQPDDGSRIHGPIVEVMGSGVVRKTHETVSCTKQTGKPRT
jgi:hypothetical protein